MKISMPGYVIDASAAVEFLLETPLGQVVSDTIEGMPVVSPELMDAEVLSVLRRWVLGGRIGEEQALRAIDRLIGWPLRRIPHRDLTLLAWDYHQNVTAYDALYVAVARTLDLPLLTADSRLSRSPGLGIEMQVVRLR